MMIIQVQEWIKKSISYEQQLKDLISEAPAIIYKKPDSLPESTINDVSSLIRAQTSNTSEEYKSHVFKLISTLIENRYSTYKQPAIEDIDKCLS